MKKLFLILACAFAAVALAACAADNIEIRNIALHRATYRSGAIDYNHTSQLVTDGIVSYEPAAYYTVRFRDEDLHRGKASVRITGFNIKNL